MRVAFLGTRGIPDRHGGFETAVQQIAPRLAAQGWDVTVYCQADGGGPVRFGTYRGVTLVHVPSLFEGSLGSLVHDLRSILHALSRQTQVIVWMGYNTAGLAALGWVKSVPQVINVDGLEWKRAKWGWLQRAILRFGERFADQFADVLIADHPEIARYWERRFGRKDAVVIPYGGDFGLEPDWSTLDSLNVTRDSYFLTVARVEPENSILEVVRAYARRKRGMPLIVVGGLSRRSPYHQAVTNAGNAEVRFVGPIYDRAQVLALRSGCRGYIHGHTVGGTNPTLVESLHAGSPILYDDNPFNRWVVGDAGFGYSAQGELSDAIDRLRDDIVEVQRQRELALSRARQFCWGPLAEQYADAILGAAEVAMGRVRVR